MKRTLIALVFVFCTTPLWAGLVNKTVDFEDVGNSLSSNTAWKGAYTSSQWNGGFTSGGATFSTNTNFDPTWGNAWYGFGYSNRTDAEDKGDDNYGNDMAAIPGKGAAQSNTYAVAFWTDFDYVNWNPITTACRVDIADAIEWVSVEIANTAYAYFNLKNGDSYNSAIEIGQYFKLNIAGYNGSESTGESVDYYLADYRNGNLVLPDQWTTVDLRPITQAKSLVFTLETNIGNDWGPTVPLYFALDQLAYRVEETVERTPGNVNDITTTPEPASLFLIISGLSVLGFRRKR